MKHDVSQNVSYGCQLCDFVTKQKKTLYRHDKIIHNTTDLLIECNQCTFRTGRKDKLAKRIKVFQNKARKAVLCFDLCDFETIEMKTLNHHQKMKHADNVSLKCQECSFITKEKKTLNHHQKTVHTRPLLIPSNVTIVNSQQQERILSQNMKL